MLLNFDTPLDVALTSTNTVTVTESVTITPRQSERVQYIGKSDDQWSWDDLRDYVVGEIERRFGMFPRDSKKEYGIFSSFLARHGDKAAAIARFAFEVEDGRWGGAPVSVNRFCKNSDPYFADKIIARIAESADATTGW